MNSNEDVLSDRSPQEIAAANLEVIRSYQAQYMRLDAAYRIAAAMPDSLKYPDDDDAVDKTKKELERMEYAIRSLRRRNNEILTCPRA